MSTLGETILITVDIAANQARLVELTKQLNENRDAQKGLADANKAGRISSDELAAGQVRLKQTAAELTGEQKVLLKANNDQIAANKAGTGSIEQLRAELALGTKAYNGLSQAERDNTEAGQKLQANNKAISDALKALESRIGDTRRSVGDYNKGIKDVNVVSGQLTGGLQTAVDKGLSPFKAELERGSGLLGKFKGGSDLVKQGLGLLKGAGETGSLGFKAIAGGIALTGIGLFVIAIGAVVTYFTQSAEGGRQLASILGGLGAVLQVATDAVSGFGKTMFEAIKNPRQAVADLVQFIQDRVVTSFKGFAVIFDAIRNRDLKGITNGFLQLGTGVEDVIGKSARLGKVLAEAAAAGASFAAREREIAILRRQDAKDDAETQSRIEVLLRLTKERGVAAKAQLAALREAGRMEADMVSGNIALAQKELQLVKDKQKAKGAAFSQELIDQRQALELEIVQTLAAQNETNARIKVRESVFREKQRTDAAAAAKAAREDAVKSKQTEVEQLLLAVQKGSAAELVLLQRQIQLAADLTLAAATQTAAEKRLILAKAAGDIAQLQAEFDAKAIENAKKHDAATVAEANREYAEALAALENYLNKKRAAVERDYALGKIGENEYQKQLNAIEKAANAAALVNAKDYGKDTGAIEKKAADLEIKERIRVKAEKHKIKDAETSIQQAAFEASALASNGVIALFGAESEAGKAALAVKKVLALAEIAINLEKQLSANATYGATLGPLGPAYVIVTDTLAIAGAVASAAKISGFKQGGYVSGPGTGTSDSIPARLSNGESVMNANSTAMFAPLLSHLNVLGGGVAFATGGLVPGTSSRPAPLNDGGLLARQAGAGSPIIDYDALAQAMTRVTVEASFTSFDKGRARHDKPRNISTLG